MFCGLVIIIKNYQYQEALAAHFDFTSKTGVRGPVRARFLEIVLSAIIGMCVCVCSPPRVLITSHVKGMRNDRIRQFYGPSVSYDCCHR